MLRKSLPLFAVVAVALAAGCAKKQEVRPEETATQAQAQAQAPGMQGMAGMCPMAVPGVKVESGTAENGAAIIYTTSEKAQVDELRRRVNAMADMHNRMHAGGAPAAGGAAPMQASTARVENVNDGAKLILTPADPANLEAVRSFAQQRVAMMQQTGKCPMMGGGCPMMQGGAAGGCPHCAQGGGCPHAQGGQCPHCGAGAPGGGGCQCMKAPGGCQCGQQPGGCQCGHQAPPQPTK